MRRLEELTLPRWQGDEEFEQLVVTILRHLPLKQASQISARALRQVLQATDGVTARIFAMFNDLAVSAIRAGTEAAARRRRVWTQPSASRLAYRPTDLARIPD
jgi:hypothetical protein